MKYSNEEIWDTPKVLRHNDVIKNIIEGKQPVPTHIELEIVNICNQRCIFCYYHGKPRHEYLQNADKFNKYIFPTDRLLELIDEFKELGVKAITFTGGGEQLLHPDIERVLGRIIENEIEFGITTNLSIVLTDSLLVKLMKAAWIRCSLNSTTRPGYNKIHNPKDKQTFERVLANIRALRYGPTLNISFVVCDENEGEIYHSALLAKYLGVTSISFRPDVAFRRDGKNTYTEKVIQQLKTAKKLDTDNFKVYTGFDRVEDCDRVTEDLLCYYSRHTAFISANGSVYPCCMAECDTKYIYGNISNKSFKEFWYSKEAIDNYKKLNMKTCLICRHYNDNKVLKLLYNEEDKVNNFV